ncbi:MAG: hypothetical protein ACPGWR_17335 [Ardenticatenaceae bacterium]
MLTNQELSEVVEDLTSSDASFRCVMLRVLWESPAADKRILPYLERLLHDKSACLLAIPYCFGEIRWLAAQALGAERAALGILEPVRLQNAVKPLSTADVVTAEYEAGIDGRGGVEGVLESFAILNEMGYLPRYDLELSYWIDEEEYEYEDEDEEHQERPYTIERMPALAAIA